MVGSDTRGGFAALGLSPPPVLRRTCGAFGALGIHLRTPRTKVLSEPTTLNPTLLVNL
jgi:hypothetical protein